MHLDQVGGFAAHGGTVIDNLDLQLLGSLIDNGHKMIGLTCSAEPNERQQCSSGVPAKTRRRGPAR